MARGMSAKTSEMTPKGKLPTPDVCEVWTGVEENWPNAKMSPAPTSRTPSPRYPIAPRVL
jgi:hypothetical protein